MSVSPEDTAAPRLQGLGGGVAGSLVARGVDAGDAVRADAVVALAGLGCVHLPARRRGARLVPVPRHGGAAPAAIDRAEVRVGCIDQVVRDTHAPYGRTLGRRGATAATGAHPRRDDHRLLH